MDIVEDIYKDSEFYYVPLKIVDFFVCFNRQLNLTEFKFHIQSALW